METYFSASYCAVLLSRFASEGTAKSTSGASGVQGRRSARSVPAAARQDTSRLTKMMKTLKRNSSRSVP